MIEIIFEMGINVIETLIIIDFLTRYLGCKYQDKRKYIGFICAWFVMFTELSITNYVSDFEGTGVLIHIAIDFIYALLFLKGSKLLKLWISALIEIIMLIIAVGTNLIVCQILDYDPNDMLTVFNAVRVISVIITKVVLFYISRMILRHRYQNPIDNQAWIVLILIPVISVISLSALMFAALNHDEITGYILCGMSGILIANIITYYFFSNLNKDYETKLKVKLLEQNNTNAKKELENANAFVQQMKSVRHGIQNQLLILSNYIKSKNYVQAEEYINSLTGNYLPNIQDFMDSDNEAFNAILNAKIAVCAQKKIYIEVKAQKNSLKNFNEIDIGILFGNLLDNAIEAAENTKNRRIALDIHYVGCYLSILIKNSIEASVIKNNSELETTKEDKTLHGIGIENIKELVNKYDGLINFFEEYGEFCCHIMLDIDKINDKK